MQTVRDEDGTTYLLLKRSSDSSKVRNPETGEEHYVENSRLEDVEGESPLETAASAVPEEVRQVMRAARSDVALGVLLDLHDHGARSVREMLDVYGRCESDLHGILAEFTVGGLIRETEVFGERGYELTDVGERGIERLREN